jgi:hypothetical protein
VRLTKPDAFTWPATGEPLQLAIDDLSARALGATDHAARTLAISSAKRANPTGVIVSSALDPAWTAALALSAGRDELIVWDNEMRGNVNGSVTVKMTNATNRLVLDACKALNLPADALGDAIDAITLCANAPVRTEVQPADTIAGPGAKAGEFIATTDLLGRDKANNKRWAWSGQIFGSEANAAYRAMSALFLSPASAWMFEGYDAGKSPFSGYALSQGEQAWRATGKDAWLSPVGQRSVRDWRRAVAGVHGLEPNFDPSAKLPPGGIDAGFIFVNSMGNDDFFQLSGGKDTAYPADVPVLNQPAMLYMIHSWSLKGPANRATLGGRWFESGVYAYVGSVHEPFLSAFLPAHNAIERLRVMPLGAAIRWDDGTFATPWRVTLLGDPLITLTPPQQRAGELPAPLASAQDLSALLKAYASEKKFEQTLLTLTQLGRDRDAFRVIRALLADQPDAVTPVVALAGIMPAFRAGDVGTVLACYDKLGDLQVSNPFTKDAVWHAVNLRAEQLTKDQIAILAKAVRSDNLLRDAREVAMAISHIMGPGTGRSFLRQLKETIKDADQRKAIDLIIKATP